MNKAVYIWAVSLACGCFAQTWSVSVAPVSFTVDVYRIEAVGLAFSTNMTANGYVLVERLNGTNRIDKVPVPLPHESLTNLLASCGTTIPQLGSLFLAVGGATNVNALISEADIWVAPEDNKALILFSVFGGPGRYLVTEEQFDAALTGTGMGISNFRSAFLDYVKANLK